MNRILFAGGGTAGHVEPAWAVSEVWHKRHPGDEIAFLGTKSGLEVTLIPERDGTLYLIPKVTAPRKIGLPALAFPFQLINSVVKTISIVKRFDVVVGFGGYVAGSAYIVRGELILILGGSTGSVSINKVISEINFDGRTVIHSLGKANDLPEATSNYRPVSYIEDMATALLAADLVISRSGAIACSEFAALGKYALFIPLPIGNGEQALNANELVAAHKAEVLAQDDFTATWLNQNLERLLKQGTPEPLGTSLNAAEQIADCIGRVI